MAMLITLTATILKIRRLYSSQPLVETLFDNIGPKYLAFRLNYLSCLLLIYKGKLRNAPVAAIASTSNSFILISSRRSIFTYTVVQLVLDLADVVLITVTSKVRFLLASWSLNWLRFSNFLVRALQCSLTIFNRFLWKKEKKTTKKTLKIQTSQWILNNKTRGGRAKCVEF